MSVCLPSERLDRQDAPQQSREQFHGLSLRKSKLREIKGKKRHPYCLQVNNMISYLHMSLGMKCANCGKGVMYGHNVSHAKNRTNRVFAPNLHMTRVLVNGVLKRMRLCTKCLRKLKKESKPAVPTVSPIAAQSADIR